MIGSTFVRSAVLMTTLAFSALAHSNLHFPTPRANINRSYDYKFVQNACQNEDTSIPPENVFSRGDDITATWFWNNHDGGFVKLAMILGTDPVVDNSYFLRNENVIFGQCYTKGCPKNGFDPGNTQECIGHTFQWPTWLEDGVYTFQWSQFGSYNSQQIPTKQLPIYHTCANVRIQGGPKTNRPSDWVAEFRGGSKDFVNGKAIDDNSTNGCAFKNFNAEPADPTLVDEGDERADNIVFGPPGNWAVSGGGILERVEKLALRRLGHIARAHNMNNAA